MLSCSALAVPSGLIGQGWHAPVRTVDSTAMGPLARLLLGHCAQLVGAWVPSSNWPTDQSQGEPPRVQWRLSSVARVVVGGEAASYSPGGGGSRAPCSRRWLYQSTHSKVASSRSSRPRQGPRRRISSVLYSPIVLSAKALSKESPREPTEVTAPASARRSV